MIRADSVTGTTENPVPADAATEAACRGLLNRLAWLVDHGDIETAIGLFTADATIDRDGHRVTGIDAVAAQFRARPPQRLTRHVLSNIEIAADGAQTARSRCYVTVYRSRWSGDEPGLPMPMTGPETLGEYHDRFRFEDGRWRIAVRTVRSILDVTAQPQRKP